MLTAIGKVVSIGLSGVGGLSIGGLIGNVFTSTPISVGNWWVAAIGGGIGLVVTAITHPLS